MNFKELKNHKGGFTLVESLVAIFILLISITGPMLFAQNGLRAAYLAKDQFTAFFLAQDAIEYIKNIRDNNSIAGNFSSKSRNEWVKSFKDGNACFGTRGCSIDTRDMGQFPAGSTIINCNGVGGTENKAGCLGTEADGSEDNHLTIDSNGRYGTDIGGTKSIFARTIYMEEVSNSNGNTGEEVRITVKVRWTSHVGIGVREITVRENIYNWIRQPN